MAAPLAVASPTSEQRLVAPTFNLADVAHNVNFNADSTKNYMLISPAAMAAGAADIEKFLISRKNASAHCGNHRINTDDVANAQNVLRGLHRKGYCFKGRAIVQVHASRLALGFNFGNGQTWLASDIPNVWKECDGTCGQAQADVYLIEDWKATYGREVNASGYY